MSTAVAAPSAPEIPFEEAILLSDFAKQLPGKPTRNVVWVWCRYGRINRNNRKKVKLQCVRLTRGMATSHAAYTRFLHALNEF